MGPRDVWKLLFWAGFSVGRKKSMAFSWCGLQRDQQEAGSDQHCTTGEGETDPTFAITVRNCGWAEHLYYAVSHGSSKLTNLNYAESHNQNLRTSWKEVTFSIFNFFIYLYKLDCGSRKYLNMCYKNTCLLENECRVLIWNLYVLSYTQKIIKLLI